MKAAILAIALACPAVASLAQSPAEKPVNETYHVRSMPRFYKDDGMRQDYTYRPTYKNIRPPLENISVVWKQNVILAETGSELEYSSGTRIKIPPQAFVDKNGNPVTGNVLIGFREFKNPLDFLLSGIPMGADSAGQPSQFISAGMFEITASVNGQEVFLKKDSRIDVNMSSMDEQPDYNLYAFDDQTGRWDQKADRSEIRVAKTDARYSKAVAAYTQRLRQFSGGAYDSTRIEERFQSMDYFYTLRKDQAGYAKTRWKEGRSSYKALVRVASVRKTKDGVIVFRLLRNAYGTHRELVPLTHVYWKVTDPTTLAQFKQKTNLSQQFFDVRIRKDGDDFIILLKNASGFREIKAVPVQVTSDNISSSYHKRTVNRLFTRYEKMRQWRERFFDTQLVKGKLANNKLFMDWDAFTEAAWVSATAEMTNAERALSFDQWESYVRKNPYSYNAPVTAGQASSNQIMRSFSITGMGVWNCDQIRRLRNPVNVMASYKGPDGEPLNVTSAFVIDKNLNGVLQYNYAGQVVFSRSSETSMVVVLDDGSLAMVLPEYFKAHQFKDNTAHVFTVKLLGPAAATLDEVRTLAGI